MKWYHLRNASGIHRSIGGGIVPCLAMASLAIAGAASQQATADESGVVVLLESDTNLIIEVRDAQDDTLSISFNRTDTNEVWQADGALQEERGIVFGDPAPKLPTRAGLRDRDVALDDVVSTFDSSLSLRLADDVTVYQLHQNELLIALSIDGMVVHLAYVGTLVENLQGVPPQAICNSLKDACCAIGNMHIESCRQAIRHCSHGIESSACQCLYDACVDSDYGPACVAWIEACWEDIEENNSVDSAVGSVVDFLPQEA